MLHDVIEIVRGAGALILSYYAQAAAGQLTIVKKADDSPLTLADRSANAYLVKHLKGLQKGVPVVAEESPIPSFEERRGWKRFWLVDPLDGTKEFLKHNGEFTVNVALIEDGTPTLGVVYAPAISRIYFATDEGGAWKIEEDEEPVRIHSAPPKAGTPLRVVTSRSHREGDAKDHLPGWEVQEEVHAGSALKFGLLAEGAADVYVRTAGSMEWDVAAGDCVYRNSAREGRRSSPFVYNQETLTNEGFVLGLEP